MIKSFGHDSLAIDQSLIGIEQKMACIHCHDRVGVPLYHQDLGPFCCHGCGVVFQLLRDHDLLTYYQIRESSISSPVFRKPQDPSLANHSYDSPEFLADFSTLIDCAENGPKRQVEFFIEGIHCLACLWLVEKIPQIIPSVISAELNLETSRARFIMDKDLSVSQLARLISGLGYRPYPLKKDEDGPALQKKEERTMLLRIGVAMAAAGNISILAISLYAGAEGQLARIFEWLMLALSLPVIFYSAIPFYQNAWGNLKQKSLSVDLPIAVSIILGSLSGLYNLINQKGEIYFDTIVMLVLLLLLARYVLKKATLKGLSQSSFYQLISYGSSLVQDEKNLAFTPIFNRLIKVSDVIKVLSGQTVPADGQMISGTGTINQSLLSGESSPVAIGCGQPVYSGTTVDNGELVFKVSAIQSDTRLGKILKKVEEGRLKSSPILELSQLWAKYFVWGVFLTAFTVFVYWFYQGQSQIGFVRALTLIIITCPCALALATPLAMTRSMSLLSKCGVIVKNSQALEKICQIKHVYFDKTGTLTNGQFSLLSFKIYPDQFFNENEIENLIYALEENSKHPLGIMIREYLGQKRSFPALTVESRTILPGFGVRGQYRGREFFLGRDLTLPATHTQVVLKHAEQVLAVIELSDQIRPDSIATVHSLKKMGLTVAILSGDAKPVVQEVGSRLQIDDEKLWDSLTPEEKLKKVKNENQVMMVGDGANDAMALASASVGVAVSGSIDVSLKAAEVYLLNPGVRDLPLLIELSQETIKLIKRNMGLSIVYNFIAGFLTLLGFLNPLWAAIIMPVSSLTVLFSTIVGTRKMRKIQKWGDR
jgi:Cu2+-exporting ATPase/Cu+-exporting ATPase